RSALRFGMITVLARDPDWRANRAGCEAAYQLVYDEACKLFKKEKKGIIMQMDFLTALGVPQEHAYLLLKLDLKRNLESGVLDTTNASRRKRSVCGRIHGLSGRSQDETGTIGGGD